MKDKMCSLHHQSQQSSLPLSSRRHNAHSLQAVKRDYLSLSIGKGKTFCCIAEIHSSSFSSRAQTLPRTQTLLNLPNGNSSCKENNPVLPRDNVSFFSATVYQRKASGYSFLWSLTFSFSLSCRRTCFY